MMQTIAAPPTNLYKALLAAQKEINHALKDGNNNHFKSKYETLESVITAIKKPLNDQGLFIVHKVGIYSSTSEGLILTTKIIHAESGEEIESSSPLLMSKQDMQQLGSCETYAKRQNLKALTNLPSEDDDGNSTALSDQPIVSTNPGDYVVRFGKKLSGKKLKDINPSDLHSYIYDYLEAGATKKNEPLKDEALELFLNGEAYLNSLGINKIPKLNTSEDIPF